MKGMTSRTADLLKDYQKRKEDIAFAKSQDKMVSPLEIINQKIEVLDDVCVIHGEPLRKLLGYKACIVCQRENIKRQEEKEVAIAAERYQKRITYGRLEKDSLVMDKTILQSRFSNFVVKDQHNKETLVKAQELANRYLNGEKFNAVFSGNPGAGKSFLAMAILQEVNEKSDPWRSCLFLPIDEFLLEIRNTFGHNDESNKENEKSMIDRVSDVDLMVLDDLGAETGFIGTDKRASDFTQRVLYNLMNKRQDKSTIITTNLDNKARAAMYDGKVLSRIYNGALNNSIKFNSERDHRLEGWDNF